MRGDGRGGGVRPGCTWRSGSARRTRTRRRRGTCTRCSGRPSARSSPGRVAKKQASACASSDALAAMRLQASRAWQGRPAHCSQLQSVPHCACSGARGVSRGAHRERRQHRWARGCEAAAATRKCDAKRRDGARDAPHSTPPGPRACAPRASARRRRRRTCHPRECTPRKSSSRQTWRRCTQPLAQSRGEGARRPRELRGKRGAAGSRER
jgi:hypothetical protein